MTDLYKTTFPFFTLKRVFQSALCLIFILSLSGCSYFTKTETPSNIGKDSDVMRISPCACVELDFDGGGFEWRS